MTIRELIEYLQQNYNDTDTVLIDDSTDGGFTSERDLLYEDIQRIDDSTIILTTFY